MFTLNRNLTRLWIFLLLLTIVNISSAHNTDYARLALDINNNKINAQLELTVADLEYKLGLDKNFNGKITWGELSENSDRLFKYVRDGLNIQNNNKNCKVSYQGLKVNKRIQKNYALLEVSVQCPDKIQTLTVNYQLMFDVDTKHKLILSINDADKSVTRILTANRPAIDYSAESTSWGNLDFILSGIEHIWIGYDHILFLLCLLLAAIKAQTSGGKENKNSVSKIMVEVIKLVTAFTIAHSITFLLANFGIVTISPVFTEAVIALTVVMVALNNIFNIFDSGLWKVVFALGLVHGLGFANVMSALEISSAQSAISILMFNAGVEIGQLLLILIFVPVLVFLSNYKLYFNYLRPGMSWFISVIGVMWFIERI